MLGIALQLRLQPEPLQLHNLPQEAFRLPTLRILALPTIKSLAPSRDEIFLINDY